MAKHDEILEGLKKRAKIYLRGIGLTTKEINAFFRDEKRCRVYILQKGTHVRLSCFDKDINRRLHETYSIGSKGFGETMWTKSGV